MPFVIGLFFLSSLLSLVIISSRWWDIEHYVQIREFLSEFELSSVIMDIMLGFLLFAGSLHTKWANIKPQLKPITLFAVLGVAFSTIIIGTIMF